MLKRSLKAVAASFGKAIVPLDQQYPAQRARVLQRLAVDVVVDIGANNGQYAKHLREQGYRGQIFSFEPIPAAFQTMSAAFADDPLWQGFNVAASSVEGSARFNVAKDSVCSSLSEPTVEMTKIIPMATMNKIIEVNTQTLDAFWIQQAALFNRPHLKIDVQGFEKQVLNGADALVDQCVSLEIELAVITSYADSYGLAEALPEIESRGFRLTSLDRGYSDPVTGQLVDVDMLFERNSGFSQASNGGSSPRAASG